MEEVGLSIHALTSNLSHNTIKIKGKVKKKPLIILVDKSNNHSFLNVIVAKESKARLV